MSDKIEKIEAEKDKREAEKKAAKKKPSPSPADEFKRKYFEFYDDVKISDRQDW